MYVDDVLLYEYGVDRLAAGKTLGSGYQFIKFSKHLSGKKISYPYDSRRGKSLYNAGFHKAV